MNKNIQILSIEAKDVVTGMCAIVDKTNYKNVEILKEQGYRILRNYKGSMDYSLLTIHLQKMNTKIVKFNRAIHRYYSNDIITVNFNYSIDNSIMLKDEKDEQYNSMLIVLDILKAERSRHMKTKNSINGKIKRLESKVILNLDKIEILKRELKKINDKITSINGDIANVQDKIIVIKNKYSLSTNMLREKLYRNGFNVKVNGTDTNFVRFLRSSGSARVGKINFVNKDYYNKLINWCMCGIQYLNNNELDLPSLESYVSLVTSSIIDTFELKAENILLIDEATSTFEDTIMATELINEVKDENENIISGDLSTKVAKKSISNVLFDGEALLCKSIFIEKDYEDKAILQIRNSFYKGLGVNTDIQKFFKDNNITEISQLKGETTATDISQIKLICTKSSIKYLKYGTFEEWKKVMLPEWAICKYEKPQSNFNGMAQSHYQLINTLGMDFNSTKDLLKNTLEYIRLLKNDISVFKLHLGIIKDGGLDAIVNEEDIEGEMTEEELTQLDSIKTNSDMILSMLKINEEFAKTKICRQFRYEVVSNYIKNVKKGHILINGTYATVVNSLYEYLLCSIGKWDGVSSTIGIGQCVTSKFEPLEDVLGVRSPQPTMSNMTVFENQEAGILANYFQTKSENVIFISAIGWNICELESSMDFDADQMLISNETILTSHCKALDETIIVNGQEIKRFLVSTDFTPKTKISREYNAKDLTDTDVKCAQGKIGECINLVQMLNSVYWTKKFNGACEEDLLRLFTDISTLNILSCVIIDSCKKSSPVNIDREMKKIREKGYLGRGSIIRDGKTKNVGIRPKFFKYLDGGKDYKFIWFECGMDYLVNIMSDKEINPRKDRDEENGNVTLKSLLLKQKGRKADRQKIQSIIKKINHMQIGVSNICKSKDAGKEKFRQIEEIRKISLKEISKIEITTEMVYTIVKRLSDSYSTEEYQGYKKIGRNILKVLYSIDSVKFLSCLQIKPNISETIVRADDGEIYVYNVKYKKICA
ncbi:hypothetical protein LL033_17350 [Clostridium estertheticum]|uniref:hypothetical protein n=1 Tax=Clostridium estertheticum TaxID=238834 RepID=UPI001C0C5795|nr:hypothetical protein [Clostridium estertheticum]MBU3216664.1 hypothetical protein [Clostridium estertheticum]WAG54380.1 hypothetical protein LL033_17350 [Clostridium estertheticum]